MKVPTGPMAGRLKRPGWRDPRLLIGITLVVVAMVGTASVVAGADHTEPFYAARDTLTPGTAITLDDLLIVKVRVGDGYVSNADDVVGKVATRVVGAGELVPATALAEPDAFVTRSVAVVTTLPLGQEVQRGSQVDVWVTTDELDGPASRQVAHDVVVEDVSRDTGAFATGGSETVYVLVPEGSVGTFLADIAGGGDVAVVSVAGGR